MSSSPTPDTIPAPAEVDHLGQGTNREPVTVIVGESRSPLPRRDSLFLLSCPRARPGKAFYTDRRDAPLSKTHCRADALVDPRLRPLRGQPLGTDGLLSQDTEKKKATPMEWLSGGADGSRLRISHESSARLRSRLCLPS